MKLHLPTALRRALLAITALLSPAVVTTTIATATLAAITAPAMADDLTLNTGSNAFATDLTVEKLNLASGITSATLEPDRSTITTLTVTADSISLTSAQTLILRNAKIIANKGIQTLLANVAGKDCISMNTSSIWGSGGSSANDVLLSSFINDKLFPNSQAYVYITKGHIQFDVGIDNYLSCNLGDGESEDSGSVSATISSELDSLKIVNVASDATLDLGGGSKGFILNIRSLEGTVKTGRDLTLTGINGWDLGYASIRGSISVCEEENSEASITLEYVKLMGGSVSAHNIILKDVTAYDNYKSTLTATNELHIQGNIELKNTIANAGSTIIDAGKSLTLGTGKFTTGAVTIGAGATLNLGSSTTNLKGIITNNGTLVLGGTITVDDTAFTAGTRERYSADNNGYKITDTTYTVLAGGAATGTATWKVGTQSATYEDGMVIVAGIEDTAVYYVRNGDVAYTRALANDTTTFSLDGGHLVLNESLKDTQSIEWKSTASWLNINNDAVELKSSQLSTVGAGNFTLIAPDGGTYIIDKKVGDIVELTLGTGVTLSDEHWWGWVKTVGDTTVSSDLDTTDWKNTELNGTTTVNSGATLTLGGNTKLKGQIVNNGTLVLGGNIDVLGSMTHTSKATFATTGDASDLGTESGCGFASSLDVYSVVEGNSATGSATWTVDGQAAHYDSGKVSLLTGKDTSTWWMNAAAAYSSISGNFVTGSTTTLALNTEDGTLQLDTDPGVKLVSKKAATIEIGNGVTLNAAQLDASAADVTLRGNGTYTLEDGANTLGEGVNVGTGWTGTVNTTGDTSALELDTLGVSGSVVELGSDAHTLAARDQEVASGLNSTGSMSLSGNKLTLNGENTLGSLNVGSLAITGGSTTITNGLTTGGESSVATGATLSLSGNSTLVGKISNSGTLVLSGKIDVLGSMTHTSKATFATTCDAGDLGTESGSGFATTLDVYSVVEGNSATGSATWTVNGQSAHYDSGKVSLLTGKDTSTWWMNAAAAYSSISGNFVTGSTTTLALNTEGGTLQLDTDPGVKLVSKKAATIEIGNAVNLNASQLDAIEAVVTLSGNGSYTLESGANALNTGVGLSDTGWRGTVNTTGNTTALELDKLGVSGSKVELGNASHTLAARDQEVAADLNSTGSMSLSGNKLTLNGENTLGSLNVGSLAITGGSTTITNGLTTGGESSVATGATLSLSGNSTLVGKISNSGTLKLGGNITIDSSTFAAGDVLTINPHYQQGSKAESMTSGFLSVDGMKIKVVTGNAADATDANWSVSDVTNGSYTFDAASGELHVVSNGSVGTAFYINTGDAINYGKADAAFTNINGQHATELVLNGGNLVLSTELLNSTMKITANKTGSVEIGNNVNLYASQLDASVADVSLTGKGAYTMANGANTLGEGVNVGTGWTGTVKVSGGASALNISSLGVSGSSIELGAGDYAMAAGNHTVNAKVNGEQSSLTMDGGNLTLNATAKLQGVHGASSITATDATISSGLTTDSISGTVIVTGGKVQEMTADSAISTSGSVSLSNVTLGAVLNNSGTLSFSGQMMLDTALLGATPNNENWYATSNAAGEYGYTNGSGFRTIREIYTVVTGTAADNTASWKADNRDAEYADGKVLAFQEKDLTTYWVNTNSEVILGTADDAFTGDTTTIALNGGKLVMDTHTELAMQSHATSTIEIGNAVNLNASQLDAVEAVVTLSGNGSYTLESGANALNTGVGLSDTGWRGTVNTTGNTTALELDKLGVSGSKVEMGNTSHTLAARDQEVAASLNSTGSVSLEGKELSLSGSNTLSSLSVGTLKIAGGSTAISGGLTTTGESSVADGANLSIGGVSSIGGKITNSGTLELGGNITVNKDTFKPGEAVENVIGYFIGSNTTPNSTNSGFEAACWDITIAEGGTITDKGATWKLVGDENATFDFAADGTLHAYGSGVGTVFHVAEGDTISYSESNAADFVNSKGEAVSAIQLNGGTLELGAALDTTVKSAAASSVVVADGVNLDASRLDTSAAAVTLNGKGSYTLGASANALNTGVELGSDWSGTVKLTGTADALELSSLGNALSSIDLGSFNHTLAVGEHVIDSALMGSGSLTLNEGSKLTLNGDCSNWSGDIIGQVELELTEGGTIGGNVQVNSLHIGESSTTFEGDLTTTGTITVSENATLSLNGNTTLGGTIENADSGKVELAGQITVDVENFKSSTEVKDVTGYFIGSNTTPNSTNSGFEAACWDITIAEGGTITDKGATWKLVGDENATFDFAADGTLHAYGSGVGTVFHVAEGDTITYSESNAADFVNSKGEAVSAIQLNGGTLELGSALETTVKSAAASSVVIADGVTLNASQLDTSAADVTLSGEGSYTMQGQELSGVVELNTGVELDTNEWKGTVYTGSTAQGAALDITALGNSQSTVYLGAQPMRRSMPGETMLESLTAAGVGTTEAPGSLTLQKGTSTADALVVNGILTLGSADAAADLVADSVSLQGLSFAHADSSLVAGSLEGATTLNVQLTDEVLSNKDAGETLTLVTLEKGFEGALTFNGSSETERVRSEDNRKEYTLAWNEAGTALTLTILGTETYVTEQVKPTTHNGKAGVALMTDVFLNSRPQKDAPDGALAGILNAVDAGTATDRDIAAVAGASTAALGMALSGDVERQLRAIRNRSLAGNDAATVTLVDEKSGMVSTEAPARFFAWVNAEGNRAEQNDDSTAAGYTLTSWGGTLGAGMQVNDKLTLGLALTAMYGDLKSDGPDYLKGDMDTAYLSAFARYNRGKWNHAFIGTAGTMEADYKRSAMSYSTDGDTDGTAFGLMYEVSRSMKLSNRSTLSPVLNISYRHTEVDSYSESGADAALNVGKQSMDTVTAGAGARYAAVVGQRMLNRACGFEARALVKYDLGDRQSTTSTGFTGYATRAGIESAELGSFGVELGAGISVPVGTGSIFADGAVELRSDYTNFNATVGYRIQF